MTVRPIAGVLLLGALLVLVGCGGRGGLAPEAIIAEANRQEKPPTAATDLFGKAAPVDAWQTAFQATPDDVDLFVAYAYRMLPAGKSDTTVEAALLKGLELRREDPMLRFLFARRLMLEHRRTEGNLSTALATDAQVIAENCTRAMAADPANAFYPYQLAAWQLDTGRTDEAFVSLSTGNACPEFRHPFAHPFPPEIAKVDGLIKAMGPNLGLFFQTNPRMFLTDIDGEFKAAASTFYADPAKLPLVLTAAMRRLEMTPFDVPSFQSAVGLNRALWEPLAKTGKVEHSADILASCEAFTEPFRQYKETLEIASKRTKEGGENPQLAFGAVALAATLECETACTAPRATLLRQIQQALDAYRPAPSTQ